MADDRRRRTLGNVPSAAVPALWALLDEHGWTQAKLAAEIDEDSGNVSRLLYGDRKASRTTAVKLHALGVAIGLWDEPLPAGWLPHAADSSGPKKAVSDDDATIATSTGTS